MRRVVMVVGGLAVLAAVGWLLRPVQAQEKELRNSLGMEFVLVPAGSFTMGSPATEVGRNSDETQHEVAITKPFYLGAYEVTQGQYTKVMGENPSFFSPAGGGKQRVEGKKTGDFPVDSVSWQQAVDFCKKLGEVPAEKTAGRTYRLPTEAEWEYACRAGTKTVFHYGDDLDAYKANFCGLIYAAYGKAGAGPFHRRTQPVGSYKPNAFGLYDMHGNVQEWVQDWYAPDAYDKSAKDDPKGPAEGAQRVLRGGGWSQSGRAIRSASRNKLAPSESAYSAGFRVVLQTR